MAAELSRAQDEARQAEEKARAAEETARNFAAELAQARLDEYNAIAEREGVMRKERDVIELRAAAAEIALEGVQREASVGSRTVLDVLDSEQELLDAKVSLVRAQRDEVARPLHQGLLDRAAARAGQNIPRVRGSC